MCRFASQKQKHMRRYRGAKTKTHAPLSRRENKDTCAALRRENKDTCAALRREKNQITAALH
jgi:hypothetical protein